MSLDAQIALKPCHANAPRRPVPHIGTVTGTIVGVKGMPGIRVNDHLNVLVMLFQRRLKLAYVFWRRVLILLSEQPEKGQRMSFATSKLLTGWGSSC